MKVEFLQTKNIEDVRDLIKGFSSRYVTDLRNFAITTERYGFISPQTSEHLCRILKKWQACRPCSVHGNLLPLLTQLDPDFATIATLNLRNIHNASLNERVSIMRIWSALASRLCNNREIADVAASKAVLILTKGQLGPALDSNARKVLKIPRIQSSEDYLALLIAISDDINAFEKTNAPILIENLVPNEWLPVSIGRAYDMAIGPREPGEEHETEKIPSLQYQQNIVKMSSISFNEAFRILYLKGPVKIVSSRNAVYDVEAWKMRDGKLAIRAKLVPPSKGYIYIHADCWGNDITCQGVCAGGIYNGKDNIYTWLKSHLKTN